MHKFWREFGKHSTKHKRYNHSECLCLCSACLNVGLCMWVGKCAKERCQKKNGIMWEEFPVWETPVIKKKKVEFIFHFRTSGTFLVFIKKSPFWVIDWNYVVGIGEHMDVCVCLCLCLCLFFCLSFWGLDCWKMFQRGCVAITIATWLVFPSCTRASHTAKINEAKFQMTMDSSGQYQKVQKCESDISLSKL